MSSTLLCLLAVLCPQEGGRRLVLPPKTTQAEQPAQPELQLSELERFKRDAMQLRRSAQLSEGSKDLALKQISGNYDRATKLALRLARTADPDLLHGLLLIVRRFGSSTEGKEVQYLLLTRPFRSATRYGVDVMAELSDDRKEVLLSCFKARYAGVRKAATDSLLALIDQTDLPRLLELSRDSDRDVQRKALFLLGALPYPEAQARLIEMLSGADPTISATACRSLVDHGPDVAPALQSILLRPGLDHSFGYAAYALVMLEDQTGQTFLTDEMVPRLKEELIGRDPFMHTTAALAMCNLAFRSEDVRGLEYGDREIVEGLLRVAAPREFVTNTSMLQRPAARKLVLFTGQDFRGRSKAWRVWWETAQPAFVGMRLAVPVTPETGAEAILTWTEARHVVRLRGEQALLPEAGEERGVEIDEYILSGAEMAALVERLQGQGFMTTGLLASAAATEMLPVERELDLHLGASRSRVAGPAAPARWLDVLQAEVDAVTARERWQIYRDPAEAPDALAYWRAEREWLAAHADRGERQRRLVDRILASYLSLSEERRARAAGHILGLPELETVLVEADGVRLAELAAQSARIDAQSFELLEIALMVPGDEAWRRVLDAVDTAFDRGGKEALPRVFSLLGADKVLAAISDGRARVRCAAILEVAKLRDQRAIPALMACVGAPSQEVADSAIYALGVLGADDARDPLLRLQAEPTIDPATRRVAWVALGRIGGPQVFPTLQTAVASPELKDRLTAIQAMGELEDSASADFLAQIFVTHGLNPLGTQAMASLQQMGGVLGRQALRRHLQARDPRVRREIVMALAEFTDPMVVPDLIAMLDLDNQGPRIVMLLSSITGLDLAVINDRRTVMDQWWRRNRDQPQAVWFLDSLRRQRIPADLQVEQLAPGAGTEAVGELTRVMLTARTPFTRVLAAAMLRDVTDRDFGTVSAVTPPEQLQAVADRYRFFADAERASTGR